MNAAWSAGDEPVAGYRLIQRLGVGGFGVVWKAEGPGGFHVALKFVPLAEPVGAVELRALEIVRQIRHPHLLSNFGAWQLDGYLIIAMELAERTLLERFREAAAGGLPGIPAPEIHEHFLDAAKGLDYLNEPRHATGGKEPQGIQHRDIKPPNLLMVGGCVKVADYGLARVLDHSQTGHTGSMTPAYAAPEFFQRKTSSQSDQYSLAVTYCHLRGGRLPFTGSFAEVMSGHLTRPPDLSMLPTHEQKAVGRALAKSPRDRWPNCRQFITAVRQPAAKKSWSLAGRLAPKKQTAAPPPDESDHATEGILPSNTTAVVTPPDSSWNASPQSGPHSGQRRTETLPSRNVRNRIGASLVVGCAMLGAVYAISSYRPTHRPRPSVAAVENKRSAYVDPAPTPLAILPIPTKPPTLASTAEPNPPPKSIPAPTPSLALRLPESIELAIGGTATLIVRVDRTAAPGPISLQFEGAPAGVAFSRATIPADDSEAAVEVSAGFDLAPGKIKVDVVGSGPSARGKASFEIATTESAAFHLRQADQHFKAHQTESAIEAYSRAIELDPRSSRARAGRAMALVRSSDWERALDDCSTALELDSRNDQALAIWGYILARNGDVEAAFARLGEAKKIETKSVWGHHYSAAVNGLIGEYDRAIIEADLALRINPQHAPTNVIRAEALGKKGEFDLALAEFDEAILLDPKLAAAYCGRGDAWRSKKNDAKAVVEYSEAIRLDPKFALAFNGRGLAWLAQKELDKAITDFTEVIRLLPERALAHRMRAAAFRAKRENDKALVDLDEAIRLDPQDAEAYDLRGEIWSLRGKTDAAIADYDEVVHLDPKNGRAHWIRGELWSAKSQHDKAIADYNEAIQLEFRFPLVYLNRGNAWFFKQEYDKAITDYTEVIRLDPRSAPAYHDRGNAWRSKKEFAKALADYDEAIRLNPKDAVAYNNRGYVWYHEQKFDNALADFNEAIRLNPRFAAAYRNRSRSHEQKRNHAQAKADHAEADRLEHAKKP
jgi:tetratricopeptide (TPR) repeat protein/serine/threonine protein kinase